MSSAYGPLDRLLHRLAFAGLEVQISLADIEDRLFGRALRERVLAPPIFITSLPRAGTTLLLELLAALPGYASHRYRDMPFLLCPLLWSRIARRFHVAGTVQERAHHDGMTVGVDSPEAFEEVLWTAFWPEKYQGSRIALWAARERHDAFEAFFDSHMRKLALNRDARRYVSKNNANIARLGFLRRAFPGALIVVPFRAPLEQAASLLRQHQRFTQLHAADPFARTYMRDIGHFEFGAALKPIAFPGESPAAEAHQIAFWIGYWTRAFLWLLSTADPGVVFLDFDRLRRTPHASLALLGERLGDAAAAAALMAPADRIRAPESSAAPADVPARLLAAAGDVHASLQSRSINARAA